MDDGALLDQMAAGLIARGYKVTPPNGKLIPPPPPPAATAASLCWPFLCQHVPIGFEEYLAEPNPDRLVYQRIEVCTGLNRPALAHEIVQNRLVLILTTNALRKVMDILVVRLPGGHAMKELPDFLLQIHTDVLQIAPPPPTPGAKAAKAAKGGFW